MSITIPLKAIELIPQLVQQAIHLGTSRMLGSLTQIVGKA
ncbi:hypothetical protein TUMEXPCC7403_18185 [Tumidithrix helvetica PCC 7403]